MTMSGKEGTIGKERGGGKGVSLHNDGIEKG